MDATASLVGLLGGLALIYEWALAALLYMATNDVDDLSRRSGERGAHLLWRLLGWAVVAGGKGQVVAGGKGQVAFAGRIVGAVQWLLLPKDGAGEGDGAGGGAGDELDGGDADGADTETAAQAEEATGDDPETEGDQAAGEGDGTGGEATRERDADRTAAADGSAGAARESIAGREPRR